MIGLRVTHPTKYELTISTSRGNSSGDHRESIVVRADADVGIDGDREYRQRCAYYRRNFADGRRTGMVQCVPDAG